MDYKMNLDDIKTTITISMGTKNRLRELKGPLSHEEYLKKLLNQGNNWIEVTKFKRKKMIYIAFGLRFLFSYNKFVRSKNFRFDISVQSVYYLDGKSKSYKKYLDAFPGTLKNLTEKQNYFWILEYLIKNELDSQFRHKGTVDDSETWKKEFDILNLPDICFKEDVLDKLNELTIHTS